MPLPWSSLLVVASALAFVGFLVWKLRPMWPADRAGGAKRRAALHGSAAEAGREEVRRARARAREAKTPRERADALLAAGRASAHMSDGTTAALGLYLRAVRADAAYCEPLRALSELLHEERPELLEVVLWRRLAHLSWSGPTAEAARCAVEGLISLYREDIRHRERARALQKLLTRMM